MLQLNKLFKALEVNFFFLIAVVVPWLGQVEHPLHTKISDKDKRVQGLEHHYEQEISAT